MKGVLLVSAAGMNCRSVEVKPAPGPEAITRRLPLPEWLKVVLMICRFN